jgi:adenylate cyclase class 2
MQEIEIKFLDVNPDEIEKKLKHLGAEKISDIILEEWLFKKPHWAPFHGRFRIRKSNTTILLAYKETTKETSEGNLEIEFPTQSVEEGMHLMQRLEVPQVRHQQKRRIHYELDGVAIDIDFWPLIPPMIEIEGKSLKQIQTVAKKLGLQQENGLDVLQIHRENYGIDLSNVSEMLFTKEQLKTFKK